MPFLTTELIEKAYRRDECLVLLPYGPLGIGKSTFACKVVAELYQKNGKPNWEAVKSRLVFHPSEFVEKCSELMERGEKDKCLVWDDAGLWLLSLEHWHPFVRAVVKYLNVARTNWGALIFTTPLPTWVIKKVRGFPQAITLKIVRASSDEQHPQRPRIARAFRYWVTPDMKKSGVREIYRDKFSGLMPNRFYYWYKPLRDSYAARAIKGMKEELQHLVSKQTL